MSHATHDRFARAESIGRFPVRTCTLGGYVCVLEVRWKIYEESDLLGEKGGEPARLTRDGGNDDGGARESASWRKEKRTKNTKFSSCRRWHEERRWNFYNDTFCARDYFRDVLAGIERGEGARARKSIRGSYYCRKWNRASTSRTDVFFSCCIVH